MGWLIYRIAATLLAALAGGLIGSAVDGTVGVSVLGALTGLALATTALLVIDILRGHALLQWLRGSREVATPRSGGLWGEIGYRVERSIRLLERTVEREQDQLSQFLSAIEASPNGVLLLDAGDQIVWCNSVAADHFGLDPQRDRSQQVTNLVRAPAFVAYLQDGRWDNAVNMPDPRGKRTLSVLIRGYGGRLKVLLSQDITEREQMDTMRRDFVANVSHEIRTPLTVLCGFIETMGALPLSDSERRRMLDLMGQQAARMQALVSDLLTLAALEGSPRPPGDRWFPVAPLLARAQTDATTLSAGGHQIHFDCDLATQLAGSENELASAVANLVNNAVRYTPDGGRVEVTWRLLPDGTGSLAVADTGIGIAHEHLPRLAERFYRVDGSRSRDTGGTGLGLAIVKHVVQRHGGELDIRSEPGKGSTFTLSFPAWRVRRIEAASDVPLVPATST